MNKGQVIKTNISNYTVVIDYTEKDALLMTENQYIVAHNIYENNGKYEWDFGDYSDNLTDAFLDLNKSFEDRKKLMFNMSNDNYLDYVKSIIHVEYGNIPEDGLNKIMESYMDRDNIELLSDEIKEKIDDYFNKNKTLEMYFDKNIFDEKLYNFLQSNFCNLMYFDKRIFDEKQQTQIRLGIMDEIDVGIYSKPEFTAEQMQEIRLGLTSGVDVSIYAKPEFDSEQMKQIRLGLEDQQDVSIYAKPEFNSDQMSEISKGIKSGIDFKSYADPKFTAEQMKITRQNLEDIKYCRKVHIQRNRL